MNLTKQLLFICAALLTLIGCGEEPEITSNPLAFTEYELDGLVMMNQDYMNGGSGNGTTGDNFIPAPGASLLIFTPGVLWAIGEEAHIGLREKYLWEIGTKGQLILTRDAGTKEAETCILRKTGSDRLNIQTEFKCDDHPRKTVTTYHLPQHFFPEDMHGVTLKHKGNYAGTMDTSKLDIIYTPENVRKRWDIYRRDTVVREPYISGEYKNSLKFYIYKYKAHPHASRARLFLFGHPKVSDGTLLQLNYTATLERIDEGREPKFRNLGHQLQSVSLIKNQFYGDQRDTYDLHSRRTLEPIPY